MSKNFVYLVNVFAVRRLLSDLLIGFRVLRVVFIGIGGSSALDSLYASSGTASTLSYAIFMPLGLAKSLASILNFITSDFGHVYRILSSHVLYK